MHICGYKRQLIAYGLVCAGSIGVFGSTFAADHTDHEKTRAESISEDVTTFNKNRGSLKEESAARAGTTTGDVNSSAQEKAAAAAAMERDGELSRDVRQFNQSGGSLNRGSAASSDMDDDTHAAGDAPHGASEKSKELSNSIEEYNENSR